MECDEQESLLAQLERPAEGGAGHPSDEPMPDVADLSAVTGGSIREDGGSKP